MYPQSTQTQTQKQIFNSLRPSEQWCHMTSKNLVNKGSENGLLHDGTMPLSAPCWRIINMINEVLCHSPEPNHIETVQDRNHGNLCENHTYKIMATLPRGQWVYAWHKHKNLHILPKFCRQNPFSNSCWVLGIPFFIFGITKADLQKIVYWTSWFFNIKSWFKLETVDQWYQMSLGYPRPAEMGISGQYMDCNWTSFKITSLLVANTCRKCAAEVWIWNSKPNWS